MAPEVKLTHTQLFVDTILTVMWMGSIILNVGVDAALFTSNQSLYLPIPDASFW